MSKLIQAPSRERANTGTIHPSYPAVQQQVSNSAAKAPSAGNAKATARRAHAHAPRCRARQGGSMKKVKSAAVTVNIGGICRQKNSKSPPSYSPRFTVGNHQKRAHTHTASGSNANETTPTGEKRERQERAFITECRVTERGRKNKTNHHFIANPEPRARQRARAAIAKSVFFMFVSLLKLKSYIVVLLLCRKTLKLNALHFNNRGGGQVFSLLFLHFFRR